MLKTVYADTYNNFIADIERSAHLRSWAEQVLLALVLKLLADKLCVLLTLRLSGTALAGDVDQLTTALRSMRDRVATLAVGDRTGFANRGIAIWSRMVRLFRRGRLPATSDTYEVISGGPVAQLGTDQNVQAAGFGEFGIALALLEHGWSANLWSLAPPADNSLAAGAISTVGNWPSAASRAIFFVRSAATALDLEKEGAFANDNAIVIHADGVWQQMRSAGVGRARTRSRAPGRTGKAETRHVSITHMLQTESNVAGLRNRFIAEMTL